MHQPSKWWTGLLPVAAIWVAGGLYRTGPIEADVLQRAKDVAGQISPDTASALDISSAGRDIQIVGPEFAAGQGAKISQAVADSLGVRLVGAQFTPVPAVKPYVLSATRAGNQITLTGSAPLPSARAKLLDLAKAAAPGATVIDKLGYGVGAPEGFEAIAARGIAEAAKLENGQFSLSDKAYSIAGAAATSAAYEAAVAATQQLPSGATLAKADIQPPEVKPFAWSANYDGVAATLSGVAPSIEARTAIARAAAASLPGKMIVDQMQIARGAPAGDFVASAGYALGELGHLSKGRVAISDNSYSIVGEAATAQAYDAAIAATRKPPAGLTLARADILAPEIKPFVWGAANDGKSITLTGMAPTGTVRDAIAEAASKDFPGKTIVNQMGIARGAPEGDFTASAKFALDELGRLSTGKVGLIDNAYSIAGEAATPQTYDTAVAALKKLPQGLNLGAAELTAPEVKPYVWGAGNDGKVITLTGLAPSTAVRDAIVASATKQFAGKTIVNDMGVARGAPAGDFTAMANAALKELGKVSQGQATLNDRQLSISGQGLPNVEKDAVASALRSSLPAPFAVAAVDIKEDKISPYVFKVEKTDGTVRLTGYAPDEAARRELVSSAKAAFFNETVEDALTIGRGAPANFVNAVKSNLPAIARLSTGTLTLNDAVASVEGAAVYQKAADQIKTGIEGGLPQGFKLGAANITVAPPGPPMVATVCQPRINGLVAKGRILFETGSANLSKESISTLDALTGLVISCRETDIEVAGHTDSVGAAASNLDLSKRRAESVVGYLKDAGVDTTRITSAGYGEAKPIASNETAEGRAQNRRIEFIVK